MRIEQTINYQLNKYPCIKKGVKRGYQCLRYFFSKKIKSEGNIIKMSPEDDSEYFFGYYDKSPWDMSGRFMLCMKAKDTWSYPDPLDEAEILVIDTLDNNSYRVLSTTKTWNVQQGCMLQWLGPDFSSKIIYNDLRNSKYCSIVLDIKTGSERIIEMPIYSVSKDGKTALSLDFSRLHNLRKGYGYAALSEQTEGIPIPASPAIWKVELDTGKIKPLMSYLDFANFEPHPEMKYAVHKVNHLMISPNGKRFMVLHRWFYGHRKYSRLITCNIDGTDMYNLSDDDMVSHCYWLNDEEIIAFENKHNEGPGYYLMKDQSTEYTHIRPEINGDGHPSISPNGKMIVTDTYPDSMRIAKILLLDTKKVETIAKVFAPFKYDNDTRCDLHPRWSRDGKYICFDGVFEGKRGLYVIPIENICK